MALAGWAGSGCFLACTLVEGGYKVPPTLPNTTQEEVLTLRWAPERVGGAVRAVGIAASTAGSQWDTTVALGGLGRQGRVVSQGSSMVSSQPSSVATTRARTRERLRKDRRRMFEEPLETVQVAQTEGSGRRSATRSRISSIDVCPRTYSRFRGARYVPGAFREVAARRAGCVVAREVSGWPGMRRSWTSRGSDGAG